MCLSSARGLRVRSFLKANSLYHIPALETVGFVAVVQQRKKANS